VHSRARNWKGRIPCGTGRKLRGDAAGYPTTDKRPKGMDHWPKMRNRKTEYSWGEEIPSPAGRIDNRDEVLRTGKKNLLPGDGRSLRKKISDTKKERRGREKRRDWDGVRRSIDQRTASMAGRKSAQGAAPRGARDLCDNFHVRQRN